MDKTNNTPWLDEIVKSNAEFQERIDVEALPTARIPGQAIITCMDPRINLEAIGIASFSSKGDSQSSVRIIRTLGAMADYRSLIVGIYLAGFREIVILMHTDCGCCLAYSKVDLIADNMKQRLSTPAFESFQSDLGDSSSETLRTFLKAFQDPYDAVRTEIDSIRQLSFIPDDLILHGLVYDLETGKVTVVVDGYQ